MGVGHEMSPGIRVFPTEDWTLILKTMGMYGLVLRKMHTQDRVNFSLT